MTDDLVRLGWDESPTPAVLEAALVELERRPGGFPRRVEVELPCDAPRGTRSVLHRRAYRLEGVARQAKATASGAVDVWHYARLADDPVEGREMFTAVMNTVTPRKRLIAHALVLDAAGHVLLCETTFKTDWELPGGIVEVGESPAEAASREMVEEMGWAPPLGRVLVVDWLRPYLGWEDALELVFAADAVSDADKPRLVPDEFEVRALHWVAEADLDAHMTPFGAARARSALRAHAEGSTLYTEAGEPLA